MNLSIRYYILRYLFLKYIPVFLYKYILKIKIKKTNKRKLNLKNPERLSDKIQWIKLYGNHKYKTILSDKILVKDFISKKIPELKYAQVYQKGNCFEDINFEILPQSFVLKTNHAWKTNHFIHDKSVLTKEELENFKKYYNKLLKINYAYWSYYELQYKDIKPQIFAEELIGEPESIIDYEVWCFNGKVEFISCRLAQKTNNDKLMNIQYFFNTKWEPVDFYIGYRGEESPKLSVNKDKIIKYAEILSQNTDFVRVDLMEINNELYFGEMTFTPYSGFLKFTPDKYDIIYGKKLILQKA